VILKARCDLCHKDCERGEFVEHYDGLVYCQKCFDDGKMLDLERRKARTEEIVRVGQAQLKVIEANIAELRKKP
jgi:hypothetical protein